MHRFRFLGLSLIFSLFLLCFFSCAESDADITSASSAVIFDFSDNENPPSARLAVFLMLANEAQRTESFSVSHEDSGYTWFVAKPEIFSENKNGKNYACSLNLVPPDGEDIPVGAYTVVYSDSAGNDDDAVFSVNYDEKLLSSTTANFKDFLGSLTENIAIYDDSDELLFMGKAKKAWTSNAAILKDYKLADTKRLCYVTAGNAIICLMPKEKLNGE